METTELQQRVAEEIQRAAKAIRQARELAVLAANAGARSLAISKPDDSLDGANPAAVSEETAATSGA